MNQVTFNTNSDADTKSQKSSDGGHCSEYGGGHDSANMCTLHINGDAELSEILGCTRNTVCK